MIMITNNNNSNYNYNDTYNDDYGDSYYYNETSNINNDNYITSTTNKWCSSVKDNMGLYERHCIC